MSKNGTDGTDELIIKLLSEDGRMSCSDIAKRVGLSRTAVKDRMNALKDRGIIRGYRAVIDTQAATGTVTFITEIRTQAEAFEQCRDAFAHAEETVALLQTTGECRLVAVCRCACVQAMRDFINRIYKTAPGILSVNANSVIDVIKAPQLS